jgi:arylsulfatase A-like enzyme
VAEDTLFVFSSAFGSCDPGPAAQRDCPASTGPWRGSTALEGSLRVPFIVRWPGQIPPGVVSNEIVHAVDLLPSLCALAGAPFPAAPPHDLDGVDQSDFFRGRQLHTNREGFPVYVRDRLHAVKWRNWKIHLYDPEAAGEPDAVERLPVPRVFNLIRDPQERVNVAATHGWVLHGAQRIVDLQARPAKREAAKVGRDDRKAAVG